jgi:FlaA1/EpsC-like NDP-sugar epimerase
MKQSHLLFYFSKLSIFAMCICFVTLFARFFVPIEFLSENLPYYIVMFYVFTAFSYVFLYKNRKTNFVPTFMITKILKFIVYLFALVIVFLLDIETNVKFAVSYCIIFFLFLIFDTITINQLSRRQVEEEKQLKNKEQNEE